jgi:hypothetical protein
MAAPKKTGGGGGGTGKKAKLAHEKRGQEEGGEKGQFRLKKVLEMITDAGGKSGVIVEIDDKGTKAVVDSIYVQKTADGTLKARDMACPALYDSVAQKNAIARFANIPQA